MKSSVIARSNPQAFAGVNYTLTFNNNSMQTGGSFLVFQQMPDQSPDMFSLAWFAKKVNKDTSATFLWQIDYDFVWSETGVLQPGVLFNASQTAPADLTSTNRITLDYNGAFFFANQTTGPLPGSLSILETGNIPSTKPAAVGIGMSGNGTFVVQTGPNMNATFTPHPEYWIAYGTYQQGQVLAIQDVTNVAQVQFPEGVYSMVATLDTENQWTVQPLSAANAALRKRKAAAK
jgi:rhizosphere induced protein